MPGILDQLSRAIDGLCPCGAQPREGSAYCSDDCTPTCRARDTSSDIDGTAMRWRPELVTSLDEAPDGATLDAEFGYHGLNARIYTHDTHHGLHLRLDDGNRWIGVDVDEHQAGDPAVAPGHRAELDIIWARLERELNNQRRLERATYADSWSNLWIAPAGTPPDVTGWQELGYTTEGTAESFSMTPAIRMRMRIQDSFMRASAVFEQISQAAQLLVDRALVFEADGDDEVPDHPLARVNAQRRNQTHGPQRRQRPPRQLTR